MFNRTVLSLSLSAGLLGFATVADAQQKPATTPDFGQQVQQRLLNNLENRVIGQPNQVNPNQDPNFGPNQNPNYNPNQNLGTNPYRAPGTNPYQPNTNPYQVQRPAYGQPGYVQPGQNVTQPEYRQATAAPGAMRYQLPAQYAGYAPGSTLNYGGATYVVNPDRTMSPVASAQPAPAAQRYQIPAEHAGAAPGSTITYGGATYTINTDNTMSPAAR